MSENDFQKINPYKLSGNAFEMIGKEWFLITAGNIKSFNTMTAAWGSFGVLWHRPVIHCFVRPTRYTYEFMENNEYFTISFFNKKYKDILNFCGTKSGRDTDKIGETGLVPLETGSGNIYFEQAKLVMECKKIYFQDLNPDLFLDESIEKEYPVKDYHRIYTGEIIDCFERK